MTENQRTQYGVLLPHFGRHVSRDRIVEGSMEIERLGFDSLWVRDHIVYRPHGYEDQDPTFWEPLVTLGAIAAVTRSLVLGTGSLIPYRHPLHTALSFATLDRLAGGGSLILGLGLGSFDHEFTAVGTGEWSRRAVLREQVQILRDVWSGADDKYHGDFYDFDDVEIHPRPTAGSIPIWYSGTSAASVRRAAEYCDGWVSGSMPRRDYRKRVTRMRRLAGENERPTPNTGAIVTVIPGRTLETATHNLDISGLLVSANERYPAPPSGRFETMADLDGAVIAGTPDMIVEEVWDFHQAGATHFVFDLRMKFDEWEECVALIGEEILPRLRGRNS